MCIISGRPFAANLLYSGEYRCRTRLVNDLHQTVTQNVVLALRRAQPGQLPFDLCEDNRKDFSTRPVNGNASLQHTWANWFLARCQPGKRIIAWEKVWGNINIPGAKGASKSLHFFIICCQVPQLQQKEGG